MTDKKISELTTLTGADAATGDLLPIVDINVSETKKITREEFFKNIPSIDINGGTIDGVTIGGASAGAITGTTITATGDVTIPDKIIHAGDTNTSIRFPAADIVSIETNGAERLRVNSSGDVGIGTSSPASKLNVVGDQITVASGSGTNSLGIQIKGNPLTEIPAGQVQGYIATGDSAIGAAGDLLIAPRTSTAARVRFITGTTPTERMRIDGTGNVGIGTGSPATTLDVNGDVTIADKIIHAGDTNTSIRFPAADTVTVETDGAERLRVTSAGNVGIGTSSPTHVLDVHSLTTGNLLNLRSDGTGGNAAGFAITAESDIIRLSTTTNMDALAFNTGSAQAERMRIDSSGNLLVGTTDAGVSGSSSLTGISLLSSGRVTASASGQSAAIFNRNTSDGEVVLFRRSTSQVGSISVTTTATAYNTSSDYRLKEDVQPMVGASDRLMALKPVNFAWKVDGSRVDGFLAHEAQEVVPEAVTGEKDAVDKDGKPEYQGIDQSKLVPLLTAALQEALTKIEALEARITALETKQ